MIHAFRCRDELHDVWLSRSGQGYILHVGDQTHEVALEAGRATRQVLHFGDETLPVHIALRGDEVHIHLEGETHTLHYAHLLDRLASAGEEQAGATAHAPMPGSVIQVQVAAGQVVQRGETLLVIESMKMETAIDAAINGVVKEIHVQQGQTFERDALLVTLEPSEAAE